MSSRDLAALRAFIQQRRQSQPKIKGLREEVGCLLLAGMVAATGLVLAPQSVPLAILGGICSAPLWGLLIFGISRLIYNRRLRTARAASRAALVIDFLEESVRKNRLHKDVDPVAVQILEACASYRHRIATLLGGAVWERRARVEHWARVRSDSLRSADEAMDDVILICQPYIGRGVGRKSIDWKGFLKELADGDIEDAFEALIGQDDDKKRKSKSKDLPSRGKSELGDSSSMPANLRPAYDIALKLKSLAAELEASTEAAASAPGSTGEGSSIDSVLEQLRQVHRAEAELDDGFHLRQGE
ncbi:MAG: hypothetical protein SNJ61_05230 [Fimbriimonadaceae bacterium]